MGHDHDVGRSSLPLGDELDGRAEQASHQVLRRERHAAEQHGCGVADAPLELTTDAGRLGHAPADSRVAGEHRLVGLEEDDRWSGRAALAQLHDLGVAIAKHRRSGERCAEIDAQLVAAARPVGVHLSMRPRRRDGVVRARTELSSATCGYSPAMTRRGGREAPFVGRAHELRGLHTIVGCAASGRGAAVLVVGDAGSGKSRLIDEVTSDLAFEASAPLRIRKGAAHGFAIERPFGAIHDALGNAALGLDSAPWEPVGSRALLEAGAGSTAAFAVADRLLEALEAECGAAPTVLVIEDLHWADGGTLRFLRLVLDRIATSPLGLILTSRPPAPGTELHRFVAQTSGDLPRTALAPLSTDESLDLARRLVGGSIGPRFSEAIKAARGSPLMVHALAEALDQQLVMTDAAIELPADASLRPTGVLASRIAELDSDAFALVQAAAVLGSTASVERLAALIGRRALDLVPVLDRAQVAGVLVPDDTGYAFRHELYRTAVLDTLSPSALAAMHLDAARTLIALGAPPLDVAEHFARGAQPGDQQAIDWLCQVANSINRRSPGSALRLVDVASSLALEPSVQIAAARVRALAGTGRAADAEALGRTLLLSRELGTDERAAVHRELALAAIVDARPSDAVDHVATVAALVADPAERVRSLAELAFARYLARVIATARGRRRFTHNAKPRAWATSRRRLRCTASCASCNCSPSEPARPYATRGSRWSWPTTRPAWPPTSTSRGSQRA